MRFITVGLIGLLLAWPAAGQSQVDYTGINRFWDLVDEFQRDHYPTDEQWSRLLDTPGYRYLVEIEGKESLFRQRFPLVFMPSKRAELDSVLAGGADRYLQHYLQVAGKRNEIEAFEERLRRTDLMREAVTLSAAYLPDGIVALEDPLPPVAFAIFEPDGKANENIVVVDLYFAMLIDLVPFLAHEAHHYYKGRINKLNRPDAEHPDYPLVRSVAQLQTEGVADLIDKRELLETASSVDSSDSWYAQHYKRHVREASSTFRKIDRLIQDMARTPSQARTNGEEIWSLLPFGAHPHGGAMAYTIEHALGREVLIETLDNPFAFIRAYNDAALNSTSGHYVFSDESMRYLHRLEDKYISP